MIFLPIPSSSWDCKKKPEPPCVPEVISNLVICNVWCIFLLTSWILQKWTLQKKRSIILFPIAHNFIKTCSVPQCSNYCQCVCDLLGHTVSSHGKIYPKNFIQELNSRCLPGKCLLISQTPFLWSCNASWVLLKYIQPEISVKPDVHQYCYLSRHIDRCNDLSSLSTMCAYNYVVVSIGRYSLPCLSSNL